MSSVRSLPSFKNYLRSIIELHSLFLQHRKNWEKNEHRDLSDIDNKIRSKKAEIDGIVAEAEKSGLTLPLEQLCRDYQLSDLERDIIVYLFCQQFQQNVRVVDTAGKDILFAVLSDPTEVMLSRRILYPEGKLLKSGIVKVYRSAHGDETDVFMAGGLLLSESVISYLLGETEDWRLGAGKRSSSDFKIIDIQKDNEG